MAGWTVDCWELPLAGPMAAASADWSVDRRVEPKVGQTAEHSVVSLAGTRVAGLAASWAGTKAARTVVR